MNLIVDVNGRFRVAQLLTDTWSRTVAICADGEILIDNEDQFYILPSRDGECLGRLWFLMNHPDECSATLHDAAERVLRAMKLVD